MEKKSSFKKNFIWNLLGTSFNAFNSFFFLIIATRINGLENAGIYTLAFSTACILYMVGIYAGRIYQVTENNRSISDKDYIVNRIISCCVIIVLIIGFVLIRHYDKYKSMVFIALAFYKAFEAFSEVLYGIMQKNNQLDKVGKSLFMKSVFSVIAFVLVDVLTKNILIASILISIVWIIIILVYDIPYANKYINKEIKVSTKNVVSIFINGFFTFAISFLGLYMTNAPKYAIDRFLTEDIQAIFGIIIMPATVMGLLAQFLIHPYLNEIFELYNSNKYIELKKILYKIILIILIIGTMCSIGGFILGTPILGLIYGLDLHIYSLQLLAILVGATFYTMAGIISPILITMRCTKIQFVVYISISVIEFILCNSLVQKLNFDGAVVSYFVTMVFYFILFYIIAMKIINKKKK